MKREVKFTRLAVILGLFVAVLGARGAAGAVERYRFGINHTDSLPNWAFVTDLHDKRPERGEYVVFVAPDNPYYPKGAAFVKAVAGVPGDRVERRGRSFFVAGRFVGDAKTHAQDGRAVDAGPEGVLPPGRYFLVTPSKDSLDSRYGLIGWVDGSRFLGVAEPVL